MNVYFTVDTESSMGGAWRHPDRRPLSAERHVFCRNDRGEYGIPLLVRILKHHGLRATFFVETLATLCLGEEDSASVFDFLLREGQDVQLHCHPNFFFYSRKQLAKLQGQSYDVPSSRDLIGHLSESLQMELLAEAARWFEKFAGYRPVAFRAGCYAGSRSLLRSLAQIGIDVDTSFNPTYHPAVSFPDESLTPNRVQEIDKVWEIPVTVARSPLPEGYKGYKFADCTALSFREIRGMLDSAADAGLQHFIIVFHSFSAVKARDETYQRFRKNQIVIDRLERVCRYLSMNDRRFRVETMDNAKSRILADGPGPGQPEVARLGLAEAGIRKAVQILNTPYWV